MSAVKDRALLRRLHREWQECALCLSTGWEHEGNNNMWIGLSLHHIHRHPRDDVEGNLVMLCGDGVRGCHGRVEAHDPVVMRLLGEHIANHRPDVVEYLFDKLGQSSAQEWFFRQHHVTIL